MANPLNYPHIPSANQDPNFESARPLAIDESDSNGSYYNATQWKPKNMEHDPTTLGSASTLYASYEPSNRDQLAAHKSDHKNEKQSQKFWKSWFKFGKNASAVELPVEEPAIMAPTPKPKEMVQIEPVDESWKEVCFIARTPARSREPTAPPTTQTVTQPPIYTTFPRNLVEEFNISNTDSSSNYYQPIVAPPDIPQRPPSTYQNDEYCDRPQQNALAVPQLSHQQQEFEYPSTTTVSPQIQSYSYNPQYPSSPSAASIRSARPQAAGFPHSRSGSAFPQAGEQVISPMNPLLIQSPYIPEPIKCEFKIESEFSHRLGSSTNDESRSRQASSQNGTLTLTPNEWHNVTLSINSQSNSLDASIWKLVTRTQSWSLSNATVETKGFNPGAGRGFVIRVGLVSGVKLILSFATGSLVDTWEHALKDQTKRG
ncbi:hypothetical protein BDR26DRAFT_850249 [Obelidium mucronatum]|nr:hypothetical protein BDR26DRAFT_850249 [Obelidium mucronatum]